jgi:hypothetical protein
MRREGLCAGRLKLPSGCDCFPVVVGRGRGALPDTGFCLGEQRHVDILEDLAWGDAKNAIGRFDQVIALAARVLAAEGVGEGEAGGELLGFDQKTRAVCNPFVRCFHECRPDYLIYLQKRLMMASRC